MFNAVIKQQGNKMTTLITFKASFPQELAHEIRTILAVDGMSWSNIPGHSLSIWQSMAFRRLANSIESKYIDGNVETNWDGNTLKMVSRISCGSSSHLVFLLKQMLDGCSELFEIDVEEEE